MNMLMDYFKDPLAYFFYYKYHNTNASKVDKGVLCP